MDSARMLCSCGCCWPQSSAHCSMFAAGCSKVTAVCMHHAAGAPSPPVQAVPQMTMLLGRLPTCPGCTTDDNTQWLPGLVELRDQPVAVDVLLIKPLAADNAEQNILQLALHSQQQQPYKQTSARGMLRTRVIMLISSRLATGTRNLARCYHSINWATAEKLCVPV